MSRPSYRYETIAQRLRGLITTGLLHPGDRLYPERALALQYRVSRNCVRQAIQTLQNEGCLVSRQGAGTFVAQRAPTSPEQALVQTLKARRERLRDVIAFRRIIEPQIAGLAAAHIGPQQLQGLKAIVCDQDRRQVAGRSDADLDAEFHRQLAQATGNRVIQEVFRTLEEILDESRADFLQTRTRRRLSVIGHLKIIDALERRDSPAAARAMDQHLRSVDRSLFSYDSPAVPAPPRPATGDEPPS